MFISYLSDMTSWVVFFVLSLGFADAFIWLDRGIDAEFTSVFYVNVLLLVIALFFYLALSSGDEVHKGAICYLPKSRPSIGMRRCRKRSSNRDVVTRGILRQASSLFPRSWVTSDGRIPTKVITLPHGYMK